MKSRAKTIDGYWKPFRRAERDVTDEQAIRAYYALIHMMLTRCEEIGVSMPEGADQLEAAMNLMRLRIEEGGYVSDDAVKQADPLRSRAIKLLLEMMPMFNESFPQLMVIELTGKWENLSACPITSVYRLLRLMFDPSFDHGILMTGEKISWEARTFLIGCGHTGQRSRDTSEASTIVVNILNEYIP